MDVLGHGVPETDLAHLTSPEQYTVQRVDLCQEAGQSPGECGPAEAAQDVERGCRALQPVTRESGQPRSWRRKPRSQVPQYCARALFYDQMPPGPALEQVQALRWTAGSLTVTGQRVFSAISLLAGPGVLAGGFHAQ
jgi:hypothetical protein